jgi:2-methylisocitrate lyase-like PEP mutase family enzyme
MNNRNVDQFKRLHRQPEPLLIGNVWNVQSARVFEKLKFSAIATSSAAVAETLGYNDGQEMSFEDYFFVIRQIAEKVTLPFSVDLEAGYGATVESIVDNIERLSKVGVVGVNLEDTIVVNGKRTIQDARQFAERLAEIVQALQRSKTEMFINVRSDVFLLGLEQPVENAIKRIEVYQTTGADGLFFPCVTQLADITRIVKAASLPINVMAMPGLPTFEELQNAGVKRISMGNFLNKKTYQGLETQVTTIAREGNFTSLF